MTGYIITRHMYQRPTKSNIPSAQSFIPTNGYIILTSLVNRGVLLTQKLLCTMRPVITYQRF